MASVESQAYLESENLSPSTKYVLVALLMGKSPLMVLNEFATKNGKPVATYEVLGEGT